MQVRLFDSDTFFHKPSDPPFQEQYSPAERRSLLETALSQHNAWIISGSISTWNMDSIAPTHGVLLNIPRQVRLQRLATRQQTQFGVRIEPGGDMHSEHKEFMAWATDYEIRTGRSRCLATDRDFLVTRCRYFLSIDQTAELDDVVDQVTRFLSNDPAP